MSGEEVKLVEAKNETIILEGNFSYGGSAPKTNSSINAEINPSNSIYNPWTIYGDLKNKEDALTMSLKDSFMVI